MKIKAKFLVLFLILTLSITSSQAISAQWQKQADFPDWLGRVDDTLALNSMISFH